MGVSHGCIFFLVSRSRWVHRFGFTMATILQLFFLMHGKNSLALKFLFVTVITTIVLIWVYTYRGGIKTIVYGWHFFKRFFLICGRDYCMAGKQRTRASFSGLVDTIQNSNYSCGFFISMMWRTDSVLSQTIFGGAFIALTMTGMDQEIMQKNLLVARWPICKKQLWLYGHWCSGEFSFLTWGVVLLLSIQRKTELLSSIIR